MTKSNQHGKSAGAGKRRRQTADELPTLLELLLTTLVGALLICRLLAPTEASVQGETLWVTQLWLAAGILWAWNRFREGANGFRFDWGDAAVAALVAGHLISAMYVVISGGEKRAAINMLWEWVGLGMTYLLVKQQLTSQRDVRRLLLVMLAAVTVLAALGVWQHFVSIPQTVRQYDEMMAELDRLQTAPPASTRQEALQRQARIRELIFTLHSARIPLEGPARTMSEFRLRSSREPFGPFALTNTFAGLLVATVIVALALFLRACRRLGIGWSMMTPALAAALIAYCLVLTKSRTAIVGLFAGVALWGGLTLRARFGPRFSKWVAGSFVAVILFAGAVAISGIGRTVVRQAGDQAAKSMLYRLEYWTASWSVAWERPFFGVGPGNFRQHYLAYKLPQSSEEILDPHNFLLDVWTSGGMIALAGMAGLLWFTVARPAGGEPKEAEAIRTESPKQRDDDLKLSHPLCVGAGAGFLLMMLAGYVNGAGSGLRDLALLSGWLAAVALLHKTVSRVGVSTAAFVAAVAALMVHLLGAGGIEMPAITQTLFLLILMAGASARAEQPADGEERPHLDLESPAIVIVSGTAIVVAFVLCLTTATLPVLNRRALVAAGNAAWLIDGSAERAARHYRDAALADPFSPEPVQKLAEIYFRRWEMARAGHSGDFDRGVEFAKLAIERDPDSPHGYRSLGNWYLKRFEQTGDRKDTSKAIELLADAVGRYPHNSGLRYEFALAFAKSGNPQLASEEAEIALELDEINKKAKHPDKYLPFDTVLKLRRMLRLLPPEKQAAHASEGDGKPAK